ncbi:hypothetical protein HanRHA438_Chr09g0380591 [Helianthus annuus]|nr:hypothetical protein HanIR_Chr09g0398091 [Helianthus annuus]KAJ0541004.1 hypothetical protein HanHA89_Chr09g0323481 [Helianthus annuus]KAJ0710213.1 hypothetical protein HanOQP8_Chr09g0309741 [Helianthus annuus]KAJ0886541.1 hypothetical protein HanRHA438_Chr09g0380591 [Helianthus annuus]
MQEIGKKMELYRAIVKLDQDGKSDEIQVGELEKEISEARQKIEFYRNKMQQIEFLPRLDDSAIGWGVTFTASYRSKINSRKQFVVGESAFGRTVFRT